MKNINYPIDKFLKSKNYTMMQLSKEGNIKYDTLKKYRSIRNFYNMQLETAYKIASTLNMSLDDLYKAFDKIEKQKRGE